MATKTTKAKKTATKRTAAPKKETKKEATKQKKDAQYVYAVGRRKSARARVKVYFEGKGTITVNERPFVDYFPTADVQQRVLAPLELLGLEKKVDIEVSTNGGGNRGQADAVKLGIARAMVKNNESTKTTLKKEGLMTRDSRVKERKKPGLKRARRAPQWQKR